MDARLAAALRLDEDLVSPTRHCVEPGQRAHVDPLAFRTHLAELERGWTLHVEQLQGGRDQGPHPEVGDRRAALVANHDGIAGPAADVERIGAVAHLHVQRRDADELRTGFRLSQGALVGAGRRADARLALGGRFEHQLDDAPPTRLEIAEHPRDLALDMPSVLTGPLELHLRRHGAANNQVRRPRLARVGHRKEVMARQVDVLPLLSLDDQPELRQFRGRHLWRNGQFRRRHHRRTSRRFHARRQRRHRQARGIPRLTGGDAQAVLELHAGAVLDVRVVRRLQHQDDFAGGAAADGAERPLQLRRHHRRLRVGTYKASISRQRVLQDDMVRLGRRAVLHANAIRDRLAGRIERRYPNLDLQHRRGRILRQAIRGRRRR